MTSDALQIERTDWGYDTTGEPLRLLTLTRGGIRVAISTLGATITGLWAPARDGTEANILLGFDDPAPYLSSEYLAAGPYFGATIGRVANRIRGARFEIDGIPYRLAANEGRHQLHGGTGFDRAVWREIECDDESLLLAHESPDGDQGYPGRLAVTARFSLPASGELAVRYEARTDRATHVNLTSHGYFNLDGRDAPDISGHTLSIGASTYTPIDGEALPTGDILPVEGTPFDFRKAQRLGAQLAREHPQLVLGDGFNHNFPIDGPPGQLRYAARLEAPASGRTLELWTTAPGLQVYSGNALAPPFARRRQAIALEPQGFPDSANIPAFPSTLLRPGETYVSETRYRFSAG